MVGAEPLWLGYSPDTQVVDGSRTLFVALSAAHSSEEGQGRDASDLRLERFCSAACELEQRILCPSSGKPSYCRRFVLLLSTGVREEI